MVSLLPVPSSPCSLHDRPVNPRGGVEAKKTSIREPADREDGRLAPQNNRLIGAWMPGSFIDQRERSSEELKSQGRAEREGQRGSKVKGPSVSQSISDGMASLRKVCVNLVYSQMGRDKLSLQELNKGTLVYSQAESQGPPSKPLSMIIIIKGSQRNSFQRKTMQKNAQITTQLHLSHMLVK